MKYQKNKEKRIMTKTWINGEKLHEIITKIIELSIQTDPRL